MIQPGHEGAASPEKSGERSPPDRGNSICGSSGVSVWCVVGTERKPS